MKPLLDKCRLTSINRWRSWLNSFILCGGYDKTYQPYHWSHSFNKLAVCWNGDCVTTEWCPYAHLIPFQLTSLPQYVHCVTISDCINCLAMQIEVYNLHTLSISKQLSSISLLTAEHWIFRGVVMVFGSRSWKQSDYHLFGLL